jgi:hypothetical protein
MKMGSESTDQPVVVIFDYGATKPSKKGKRK